jgi:hypothetical protein
MIIKMKKRLFIIVIGLFPLFSWGQKSVLKQTETSLLTKIDFKVELFTEIKEVTKNEIKQLPAIEEETGDILGRKFFDGVFSEVSEERAVDFVKKSKTTFKENGYLIFVFEGEGNKKNIAVIKGTDELDILRYRKTNGINYGLGNSDIINKISEWKAKYGLMVIGCGRDWLQVEFDKLPTDLETFANEVFAFCPDSVDQGAGTIEKLKETILEQKGVWLWWD